ncbi:MAG TPA: type II toxin-antitoxin system RelE/ParE family toxin [Nitrososphaerales archaeon]
MTYAVLLTPKAANSLRKLKRTVGPRMIEVLESLESHPEVGERLAPSQFWKVRVGDFRVIYEIHKSQDKVIVLFIGHRKNVYDEFSRLA